MPSVRVGRIRSKGHAENEGCRTNFGALFISAFNRAEEMATAMESAGLSDGAKAVQVSPVNTADSRCALGLTSPDLSLVS